MRDHIKAEADNHHYHIHLYHVQDGSATNTHPRTAVLYPTTYSLLLGRVYKDSLNTVLLDVVEKKENKVKLHTCARITSKKEYLRNGNDIITRI
jgi:hypothetical protein